MARTATLIESVDRHKAKEAAAGSKPQQVASGDLTGRELPVGDRHPTSRLHPGRSHPEVPPRKRPRPTAPPPKQETKQAPAPPPPAPRPVTQAEAFEEMVRRANQGNETCLRGLREILDQRPEIWRNVGDVGALAERLWAELLARGNRLAEESILRKVGALKASLAGPAPTPLEDLLVDYLGVTWLAAHHAETTAAQEGGGVELAKLRLKRAESAQKRFTGAVKTLTLVKALLPQGASMAAGGPKPREERIPALPVPGDGDR